MFLGTVSTMVNGSLVYGSDPTNGQSAQNFVPRHHRQRGGFWQNQSPVFNSGWQMMGWPQEPSLYGSGMSVAPGYYSF